MRDEQEELDAAEPAIWDNGVTLSPEQTKDVKVHLTLRIDADLYRRLLRYKVQHKMRTITAAVEAVIRKGLASPPQRGATDELLDDTIAHNLYQDQLLAALARNVHLKSDGDKKLVDKFLMTAARTRRNGKNSSAGS